MQFAIASAPISSNPVSGQFPDCRVPGFDLEKKGHLHWTLIRPGAKAQSLRSASIGFKDAALRDGT
jgi:hypothetical protein